MRCADNWIGLNGVSICDGSVVVSPALPPVVADVAELALFSLASADGFVLSRHHRYAAVTARTIATNSVTKNARWYFRSFARSEISGSEILLLSVIAWT